jgi:DNA topoisomerase-2
MQRDFITAMITPIVKLSKGREMHEFYTLNELNDWKSNHSMTGWSTKYYKGLGTSTAAEAKEYFKKMEQNTIEYEWDDNSDESMLLAFKKDRTDDRKNWILEGVKSGEIAERNKTLPYSDFIHKDLIWFSIADVVRSIPSMVDGFKPSQRKVLYAFRKRKNTEAKVSQLAGYISTETSYHHGEQSLMGTVISMAQDFVGSNGMNLLIPKGQFGTRYMGGKDAASPRYIFTKLSEHATKLFRTEDDSLLDHLDDDGHIIEPKQYYPVIPLILINGADGIGTGYSTSVPCYNPEDIKANIINVLDGKNQTLMTPWYKGFKGTIEEGENGSYITHGVIKKINKIKAEITELPIGKWTQDYKEFLDKLEEKEEIERYENHSNDLEVKFIVHGDTNKLNEKHLKLTSSLSTRNMHLFDENGHIKKYESPEQIIKEFVRVRMSKYEDRKAHILEVWTKEMTILGEKIRFIRMVVDDEIVVFRRKKEQIVQDLKKNHFKQINGSYDYLMDLKIHLFTEDMITEYNQKAQGLHEKITQMETTSARQLWENDLK